MEPSPPHILRVPAEILSSILSLAVVSIVPSGSRYLPNAFELTLAESPFHCVRSTCRTFRQIVDQLPFWKKDEFSIAEIEEFRRKESHWVFDQALVGQPDGTDVLLSDPHLQQCLIRKRWVAESPHIFDIQDSRLWPMRFVPRTVHRFFLNHASTRKELEQAETSLPLPFG
jgi:hypothetical protein